MNLYLIYKKDVDVGAVTRNKTGYRKTNIPIDKQTNRKTNKQQIERKTNNQNKQKDR